jgi:Chain length determinant protein
VDETNRQEIELGQIIALLYRQRIFIISGVVAVSVLVAIYSLMAAKTFQASAEILVSPPRYKNTMLLASEPPSVVTYEKIADDANLKTSIIRTVQWLNGEMSKLKDTNASIWSSTQKLCVAMDLSVDDSDNVKLVELVMTLSPEERDGIAALKASWLDELGPSTVDKIMEVQTYIEEETNLGVKYAIALTLVARAPNPQAARAIANLWAITLQRKDDDINQKQVDRSILSITRDTEKVRQAIQEYIMDRNEEPLKGGEEKINRLTWLNSMLYGITKQDTTTDTEKGTSDSQTTQQDTGLLGKYEEAMQKVETLKLGGERLLTRKQAQEDEGRWIGDTGVLEDASAELDQALRNDAVLSASLAQFDALYNFEVLEASLEALQSQETIARQAVVDRWDEVRPYRDIGILPPTTTAIGSLYAEMDRLTLTREAAVAELAQRRDEKLDMNAQYAGALQRLEVLQVVSGIENKPGSSALKKALEEKNTRYIKLLDKYNSNQNELAIARSEADTLKRHIDRLTKEKESGLSDRVDNYLIMSEVNKRRIDRLQPYFENEENVARLVESYAEGLLRAPNLKISSAALAPNKRISPQRSKMVLIGACAALLLFTIMAFVRDSWQRFSLQSLDA